jgi:hypothetical protein
MKIMSLLGLLLISAPVMADCEFSYTEPRTGERFTCEADEQDLDYLCGSPENRVDNFYCKNEKDGKQYGLQIDTRTVRAAVKKSCPGSCRTGR